MPPIGPADPNAQSGEGQHQGDEGNWREENTRLRQELAESKAVASKAMPWVQVAVQLQKQEPEIFDKLARGEALTKTEQKKVDETSSGDDKPMTRGEFTKLLQENLGQVIQQINVNNQAAKSMGELQEWATETLPGYDKVFKLRAWNGILSSVLGAVENGALEVPADVEDPYKFIVETTYDIFKAKNPELLKGGTKRQSAEDRAAELLTGGRKPSSSRTMDEGNDLPDEIQKEIDFIRSIGQGRGKKFSP